MIDTSDMDNWRFPQGTKLWKEFSVTGQRVETRLLYKSGSSDDDWIALSYVWNEAQSEAVAAPWGVVNVRGDHDVPAAGECMACHGGRKGRVLGFSAVQLAEPADPPPSAGAPAALDLHELIAEQRLSRAPSEPLSVPGNELERAALGYLHANCSHCHNQDRPQSNGARCFDSKKSYDFTLSVSALDSPQSTPTYRTAVGSAFKPGNPDGSKAIDLVSDRGMFKQMPPLATEHVDALAVANPARLGSGAAMTPDLQSLAPPGANTLIIAERATFGIASAPFDVRTLSEAKGQALSFVSDAWYQLSAETWIGLRLPLVAASVRQPAGSYLDESAWGNPELRLAKRFTLTQEPNLTLRLTVGGGVGVPLAEYDPSLMPNRALAIANALQGFADPELFTPGELPFTPFVQLDYSSGPFRALALLKVPALFRVSDADLPSAQSNPHAVALTPVLVLEARYSFTRHFGVALASQLTLDALPPNEHLRSVPLPQLLLRGSPYFELGPRGALFIDLQAPIAGALGGSTVALGLRGAVQF